LNKQLHLRCNACGTIKHDATMKTNISKKTVSVVTNSPSSTVAITTAIIDNNTSNNNERYRVVSLLYFSVSIHSGRIYLYNNDQIYMNISFSQSLKENEATERRQNEELDKLMNESDNRDEIMHFLNNWVKLRSIEQTALCTHIIRPPLVAAYHRLKSSTKFKKIQKNTLSFTRYSSLSSSSSSSSLSTSIASTSSSALSAISSSVSSPKSNSTCVQCSKDISLRSDLLPSGTCSWSCHQELSAKLSGSSIRRQLFELEHGICVLCSRDMHKIYQRFVRLQPSDRVQECMLINFSMNDHLLHSPNEGMFWQADHILPVSEGGGECTMENIRTLCTTCHQKETNVLRRRLRDAKLGESAKGTKDIRGFFSNSQKKKKKNVDVSSKSLGGSSSVVDLTL
jgi:5-methylcytosine-specific restriction endonuclease McrA